jgi:hypothetical protein
MALQKLRRNLPLTVTDLEELDRMLQGASVGDLTEIERARLEGGGLGPFIRSLIGLDRNYGRSRTRIGTSSLSGAQSSAQIRFD